MKIFCMGCLCENDVSINGAHCKVCNSRYVIFRDASYTDALRDFLGVTPRRVTVTEEQARELDNLYTRRRQAAERAASAEADVRAADGKIARLMDAISGAEVTE